MNTRTTLDALRKFESRNITFLDPDGTWPIVWERAKGMHVWDVEGRKYLDLTAAFGVAAAGHANTRVVRAGQRQMETLLHAMGDVHPHALKAQLARKLSHLTFKRWSSNNPQSAIRNPQSGKTIFCNSGFEAVEAALKTAHLATGRPGIIAFEGAYHGLGYGALNATHREHFRGPFQSQLGQFGHFVSFPQAGLVSLLSSKTRIPRSLKATEARISRLFRQHKIGAILVEPIQARGGINIPPPGFLPMLRKVCNQHGALLIVDEIYTGFGRTGTWFACEHSRTIPDLICLGKALTGGFPLSACVGRSDVMDAAWPESAGEAIHTSTFLGHPVGCAMALAQLAEIRRLKLVQRSARLGKLMLRELELVAVGKNRRKLRSTKMERTHVRCYSDLVRGLGLMIGLELRHPNGCPATEESIRIIKKMLRRGFILLPEGERGNVISLTPPLTITAAQIKRTVRVLSEVLRAVEGK